MAYNGYNQPRYQDATNQRQPSSSSRYPSQQQQPMSSSNGQNLQHTTYAQGQTGYGWPPQSAERSGREGTSFGNARWGSAQQHQLPQDYSQQRQQSHGSLNAMPAANFFPSPRQSQSSLNAAAVNNRAYGAATETSGSSISGSRSNTPLSGNRGHPVKPSMPSHDQRPSDFLANLTNPSKPSDPTPPHAVSAAMYQGLPYQSTSSNFQRQQVSSPYQPHVTTYSASVPSGLAVDTPEDTVPYSASHANPSYSQPASRIQTGATGTSASYGMPQNRPHSTNQEARRDQYAYQKPPTPEAPEAIPPRNSAPTQQQLMMTENYPPASRTSPTMGNPYGPSKSYSSNETGVANLLSNLRDQNQSHLSGHVPAQNTAAPHNATPPPQPQSIATTSADAPMYQYSQSSPTSNLPGFVDPSFIYNPYHDERRRAQLAEIEAERNRQVEEANNAESTEGLPAAQPDNLNAATAHELAASGLSAVAAALAAGTVGDGADNQVENQVTSQAMDHVANEVDQVTNPPEKKKGKRQPKKKAPPSSSPKQPKKRGPRGPRKSAAKAAADPANAQSNPPAQENSASIANLVTPTQEEPPQDMASEMKLMIDRMREFKSKDPSLFSKLWEDLKKGQPQTANGATPTPTPQEQSKSQPQVAEQQQPPPNGQNGAQKSNEQPSDPSNTPATKRKGRPRKPRATDSPASAKKRAAGQVNGTQVHSQPPALRGGLEPPKGPNDSGVTSNSASQPGPGPTTVGAPQAAPAPQAKTPNSAPPTLWPEAKQKTVAHEVAKHLLSDPRNKDKENPEAMILSLVNEKPSYSDLCQTIENRGFILNRGDLARHILRVVPDLNGNASRPPPAEPSSSTPPVQQQQPQQPTHPPIGSVQFNNVGQWNSSTVNTTPTNSQINNTPVSGPPYPPANTNTTNATAQPPSGATYPPIQNTPAVSQPSPHTNGKNSVSHILRDSPGVQNQPPAPLRQTQSKASTSPGVNRLPKGHRVASVTPQAAPPNSKAGMARKRDFSDIVDLAQGLSDDEEDMEPVQKMPRSESMSAPVPTTSHVEPMGPTPGRTPGPILGPTPGPILGSSFGSSLGSTPAQYTPEQASKASGKLDLSSFKRSEEASGSKKESLRRYPHIVQPINKTEALRTSYYDPKTIARDILIAAGRHPTERALNAHLSKLQQTFSFVDSSSDLETFRWDLVDPGGPQVPNVEAVPVVTHPPSLLKAEHQVSTSQSVVNNSDQYQESARDSKKHANPKMNTKIHSNALRHHRPSSLHITQTVNSEEVKTPTRQKGKDNSTPQASSSVSAMDSSSAPAMASSSAPAIPGPRRRGRPRKHEHESRPTTSATKRKIEVAVPVRSLPPQYNVYQCKWHGCASQLHNIKTLEKHFQKVHRPEGDRKRPCLWTGCRKPGTPSASLSFTPDQLSEHVRKTHIEPMAWNLGEGPTTRRNDDLELVNVLNDFDGCTVTPASTTQGPRDTLLLPAGYIPIRAFHRARGNITEHSKAKEFLAALRSRKSRVGFAVDREGSSVGNYKRIKSAERYEDTFQATKDNDHLSE
ncbi:hypothetical protein FQN54_008047 [Arachnomyces sp. PD_36]|nr:hypothetical protein FQN54_008047 [Arachnomyces sp. PD_36]